MVLEGKRRLRFYRVDTVFSDCRVVLLVLRTDADSVGIIRKAALLHHVGYHKRKVYVEWLQLRVQECSGDNVRRRISLEV